jgi:hypothetical protein
MGIFNIFGDGVSFGTSVRTKTAALADSKYKSGLFKYPIDLGAPDKGHHILININEQINTSFPGTPVKGVDPRVIFNKKLIREQFGGYDTTATVKNALGAAKAVTAGVMASPIGPLIKGVGNFLGPLVPDGAKDVAGAGMDVLNAGVQQIDENIGVRTIRRITDSIALYMPNNLVFSHNQSYTQLTPGGSGPQTVLSALNSASDTYRNSGALDAASITKNLSPFLLNYLFQQIPGGVGQILFTAGSGGKVQNPMIEMLYSSPSLREFNFDFLMFPRSEVEAIEVQAIIEKLRFHQAPELVRNSGGYFLYPPSEFDISFYYNGQINPNIPRISTCVLTKLEVDYSPGGFAAYEVEGNPFSYVGGTGMPVGIRLSLGFKETEYLVKGSPLISLATQSNEIGIGMELRDDKTGAVLNANR